MPPSAILRAVFSTISNARPFPVRFQYPSRNSSDIEGGNFGAPPKPPFVASYEREKLSNADSNRSGEKATDETGVIVARLSSPRMSFAELKISSRRSRYASEMLVKI